MLTCQRMIYGLFDHHLLARRVRHLGLRSIASVKLEAPQCTHSRPSTHALCNLGPGTRVGAPSLFCLYHYSQGQITLYLTPQEPWERQSGIISASVCLLFCTAMSQNVNHLSGYFLSSGYVATFTRAFGTCRGRASGRRWPPPNNQTAKWINLSSSFVRGNRRPGF